MLFFNDVCCSDTLLRRGYMAYKLSLERLNLEIWNCMRIIYLHFLFGASSKFLFHFNIVLLLFLRVYGKRKWQIKRIQSVHLNTTLPQILLCVYVYWIWWYELNMRNMNWIILYELNKMIWFDLNVIWLSESTITSACELCLVGAKSAGFSAG